LATERKTPLSEAAPSAQGRSKKTAARSKAVRRRALIGGGIAVVVLGVAAYLMSGGDLPDPIQNILPGGRDTPEFAFDSVKFQVESTTESSEKDLQDAAQGASDDIEETLTAFIQGTFVDPDTWGDYDGVFGDAMTKEAAADAAKQADALTLGAKADADYEFVTPDHGVLRLIILTDLEDRPAEASAIVTFTGTAEAKDGTFTKVRSKATYLLRLEDGTWRIFSFDVLRNERAAEAPASGSTTPSPSAEAAS
jgi:hypothetical protein